MIIEEYLAKTGASRALAERAMRVLPDGVSTDTRLFDPYGIYVERAAGTKKWDADGNEYRDYFGGHGALMLGHCHPRVTRAIQDAAALGVQFAANTASELEWAEAIKRHIPTAERVRFAASGSEATLLAIRIARAYTGRSRILRIKSHYHGWHDFAVSGYNDFFDGTAAPGVLPEIAKNTCLVNPNDGEDLRATVLAHRGEIAAILLEPLGSHFGIVPTSDEYLHEAAALAKENGILVILDEVITAFRVAPCGMQGVLHFAPDLTCMGKVAAGGMPGGIVCGSEDVISVLCRNRSGVGRRAKVFHQGTFTGNPITAKAALVTIQEVVERNLCDHASRMADQARTELNRLFERMSVPWQAYGRFSAFHVFPDVPGGVVGQLKMLPWEQFATRSRELLRLLRIALNLEGVDIGARGTGFFSGVHQLEDVEYLVAAFERALIRLRRDRAIS